MPTAQFVDPVNNVRKTRSFLTPKQITKEEAWLSAARKSIPEIPKTRGDNPTCWTIHTFEATRDDISIQLVNKFGSRCYVAIKRRSSF